MRRKIKRLSSFLLFNLPVSHHFLTLSFTKVHNQKIKFHEKWTANATRYKLIGNYWLHSVQHFFAMTILAILLIIPILNPITSEVMIGIIVLIPTCYIILYYILYRPTYNNDFLPILDLVAEEHEGREKLWMDKCKQEQLSTRGLVLFFYILDHSANIHFLAPNDKSANLLQRIFGVSQKGLKNELDLLFKKEKRLKIEQRKETEVFKSFEEVFAILEEMQFPKGVQLLKELESRFSRPK